MSGDYGPGVTTRRREDGSTEFRVPTDGGVDQGGYGDSYGEVLDADTPLPDGMMPDGSAPPACLHPPSERRLADGQQVCLACGETVESYERQAIVPKDRPGSDPTMREETAGGLRHVTVPREGETGRPYTPDQIERELVVIIDRIERGAGWLTTQEEKRAAAKLQYELAYAKARFNSNARSSEQRADDALLQCRDLYEEWQQLELVCRTAREGLHNLRSMQSGLQTVARSIGTALGGYR